VTAAQKLPTTTKAVRVFEHGEPDRLVYGEYPLELLGPTGVLIEVDTAPVSGWDLHYRSGGVAGLNLPGRRALPMPQQLGREAAGTVVGVGVQVTRFVVGQPVVAVVHPENPRSVETYRGLGNLSTGVDVPGHVALAGYAQYLIRDEQMWLAVPSHVDVEQAAVTLWSYATAHRVVRDRLHVALGDSVLVCGASGGMGEASVRLAKLAGAKVAVTTRYAGKVDLLRSMGADEVVVTHELIAVGSQVREWTAGEGVDQVVDYTGDPDLLRTAVGCLRLGGRICPASGMQRSDGPPPFDIHDFTRLDMTVTGVRGARHQDALTVLDLLARGAISSRIAGRFSLSEADQAHTVDGERVRSGRARGAEAWLRQLNEYVLSNPIRMRNEECRNLAVIAHIVIRSRGRAVGSEVRTCAASPHGTTVPDSEGGLCPASALS